MSFPYLDDPEPAKTFRQALKLFDEKIDEPGSWLDTHNAIAFVVDVNNDGDEATASAVAQWFIVAINRTGGFLDSVIEPFLVERSSSGKITNVFAGIAGRSGIKANQFS